MWTLVRRILRRAPKPDQPTPQPRHRKVRDPHDPLHTRPTLREQWHTGRDFDKDTP